MGTPDFAATILNALIAAGHRVVAVYTQPPRPAGRGHRLQASPVQLLAERHGLIVRSPARLRDDETEAGFAALGARVAVVAAYGLILPQPMLIAPRLGCLNVHASLLPRWRGAAPVQRALLAGDSETGITIMQMEAGLDTGPMLLQAEPADRPDGDRRRPDRRPRPARRQADRRRCRCAGRRRADAPSATARRRRLCAQDQAGGGAARLAPPGGGAGAPGARPRFVARRVFRPMTGRASACLPRPLSRRLRGASPGSRARRASGDRLRVGLAAAVAAAAAGPRAARCGRVSARLSDRAWNSFAVPRYRLTIEYDGAGLVGWQRQPQGLSVQEALETAILRFCGEPVRVHGAGRTDAGVHALGQVAHLDLARAVPAEVLRSAVNHHLRPAAISVACRGAGAAGVRRAAVGDPAPLCLSHPEPAVAGGARPRPGVAGGAAARCGGDARGRQPSRRPP